MIIKNNSSMAEQSEKFLDFSESFLESQLVAMELMGAKRAQLSDRIFSDIRVAGYILGIQDAWTQILVASMKTDHDRAADLIKCSFQKMFGYEKGYDLWQMCSRNFSDKVFYQYREKGGDETLAFVKNQTPLYTLSELFIFER